MTRASHYTIFHREAPAALAEMLLNPTNDIAILLRLRVYSYTYKKMLTIKEWSGEHSQINIKLQVPSVLLQCIL